MTTMGDRLKRARENAGIDTAKDAADAMGIPVPTYTQHESGLRGYPANKARKYAEFYRVSPEWLLYGKGDGPDADAFPERPTTSAERTERSETVSVNEYDVRLSAGPGAIIEGDAVAVGTWQFSRRYIVDELRLSPTNLAVVEVQGDSMMPTLQSGDRVLVDHSDRNPAQPGVYAIWDSNATVVKRIEKIPASDPPKIVLISDNKSHHEYTVDAALVNVIGRVVWFARRL